MSPFELLQSELQYKMLMNKPNTARAVISGRGGDPRRPGFGAGDAQWMHKKVAMPNSSYLYHSNHLSNDQFPYTRYDHSQLNPPPEMPRDGSIEAGTGLTGLLEAIQQATERHDSMRRRAPLSQFIDGYESVPQRAPSAPPPQMPISIEQLFNRFD